MTNVAVFPAECRTQYPDILSIVATKPDFREGLGGSLVWLTSSWANLVLGPLGSILASLAITGAVLPPLPGLFIMDGPGLGDLCQGCV